MREEAVTRLLKMTEDELDDELRLYGIDPEELTRKLLARLREAQAKGIDTPILREAIRQFEEREAKKAK